MTCSSSRYSVSMAPSNYRNKPESTLGIVPIDMTQTRSFTPDQVARYARHLILPEVGGAGQRKLLNSSVLLLGAGGLGSPAAMYLAAAGVGKVGIVDFDVVDASNLQRQLLPLPVSRTSASWQRAELRRGRRVRSPARDHRQHDGVRDDQVPPRHRAVDDRPLPAFRRRGDVVPRAAAAPKQGVPVVRREPDCRLVDRLRGLVRHTGDGTLRSPGQLTSYLV